MDDSLGSRPINSQILEKEHIRRQLESLKIAVEEAQYIQDYEKATDKTTRKMIEVVESFLRKSGRVCYGGQAINAHLPKKLKFYDEEKDIPDYDFFSPDPEADVEQLVQMFKDDGFTDISSKKGIHEGTTKLYVNYIPVADITQLDPEYYELFSKYPATVAGIRYINEDILRMMMYLELSRPRGEVGRWEKVFERLTLLNTAKPIQRCTERTPYVHPIPAKYREKLIQFLIAKKRILAGAEVGFVYRTYAEPGEPQAEWIVTKGGPVIFFSPKMEEDAQEVKEILGERGVTFQKKMGYGDYIPDRIVIRKNKQIVAYLVEEVSCNSYVDLKIQSGDYLRIASLDTLVYLYLLLGLLTNETKTLSVSLLCLAQRYIELVNKIRGAPETKFPRFALTCSGHQKTFESLQRERDLKKKATGKSKTQKKKRTGGPKTKKQKANFNQI